MVASTWEAEDGEAQPGWLARVIEAQRGRAFLWAPVALTFGVWSYFGLANEPSWLITAGLAAVALLLIGLWRHIGIVLLLGIVLAGFGLAKLRTELVATPLLHATTGQVSLTAHVESLESSGRRQILIVSPSMIEGIDPPDLPRRLRLSVTAKHGSPRPGDVITAKARLAPVPGPVMPGGFDYGRQLYFEGIGGTGRVTQPMTIDPGPAGTRVRIARLLENTRRAINARITAVLEGNTAAIAEALIDGERGAISKLVNTSFQISGLAHVLSISGLHMSLIAGGMFWLVRAILALVPAIALRWPIKKIAAVAALASGLFYMVLAGSEVATQRSYIMIAVVFFAVLVDRPALSLRNLALAAMLILVLQPEAATQAGFQMSFLAVLGLAAFFEAWDQWRRSRVPDVRQKQTLAVRALRYLVAAIGISLATTIVAGFMSAIPAAYHFGRIAPYGLIANGLAIPVVSLIVMPMGLLATLLMPLGLEHWPLWIMGQGIDIMSAISDGVAGLPGAQSVVPQQSAHAAILAASGAAALALFRGKVRLAGLAIIVAGSGLVSRTAMPDILINRTASNAAIINADGELVPALARKDRFAVEKWLIANGEEATPSDAAKRQGWNCTEDRCKATLRGKRVLFLRNERQSADCTAADIVIASFPLRRACASVPIRIDRFDVWKHGSHALRISELSVTVATARGLQGERPWVVIPQPRRKTP